MRHDQDVPDAAGLLTARERRKFSWLVLVMLLVGIFETAGVASVLPFMAVLAEPERIQTSAQLVGDLRCAALHQRRSTS